MLGYYYFLFISNGSINEYPKVNGSINEYPKVNGSINEYPKVNGSINEYPKVNGKWVENHAIFVLKSTTSHISL